MIITITLVTISCGESPDVLLPEVEGTDFFSAVDISTFPQIELSEPTFYSRTGRPDDLLEILKANGVNTIRLRLWVNPENQHSGFEEVTAFSQRLREKGFRIWLALHFSDTWADPGQQRVPEQWADGDFLELKAHVKDYTRFIVEALRPELVQIGNEINTGFLHPWGNINTNKTQFIQLLNAGIQAVRRHSAESKIMLHFAGVENSRWFFEQVETLDYDIIGLSYYPIWHGKDLGVLVETMAQLSDAFNKDIMIAETAYPFTLTWNDQTNNIVGLQNHLVLPAFPASPRGQADFVRQIRTITRELDRGIGFCYWGAELVAWKGAEATDGSPWENQALFDFNNEGLPALEQFQVVD